MSWTCSREVLITSLAPKTPEPPEHFISSVLTFHWAVCAEFYCKKVDCRLGPTCLLHVFGSLWFFIHVHWACARTHTHTHTWTYMHTHSHPLLLSGGPLLLDFGDNAISPNCHSRRQRWHTHAHTQQAWQKVLCVCVVLCSYTGDAPFLGPGHCLKLAGLQTNCQAVILWFSCLCQTHAALLSVGFPPLLKNSHTVLMYFSVALL